MLSQTGDNRMLLVSPVQTETPPCNERAHALGENAVKNPLQSHADRRLVGLGNRYERTTGFLSILLKLEKCREFCHCFLKAARFI